MRTDLGDATARPGSPASARSDHQASSCSVIHSVALATVTMPQAEVGRGSWTAIRKSRRLTRRARRPARPGPGSREGGDVGPRPRRPRGGRRRCAVPRGARARATRRPPKAAVRTCFSNASPGAAAAVESRISTSPLSRWVVSRTHSDWDRKVARQSMWRVGSPVTHSRSPSTSSPGPTRGWLRSPSRAAPIGSGGAGIGSTAGYTRADSAASIVSAFEKRPKGKRVNTTNPRNSSGPRRAGWSR